MELVRDMLPILDDFDRARKVEAGNPEYAKGVEMIYSRMYETLKRLGWSRLKPKGSTSTRISTQAVERVETKTRDGTILGEFQRGYLFQRRSCCGPSMVKVAVHS